MHTCLLGEDAHTDLNTEEMELLSQGICPLCLHDTSSENACIECGHLFEEKENGVGVIGMVE